MANSFTVQTLIDGVQKVVVNIVGILDTADLANTTILDPATLLQTNPLSTQLRIDRVTYDVETGLAVQLLWDATTPVVALTLVGNGPTGGGAGIDATKYGGIQNNAGAGKTGKILLNTLGWVGTKHFSIQLEATKQ